MDLCKAAVWYAARGWSVLPCDAEKHPIGAAVPHGLKDAVTDPETLRAWWVDHPTANIGIACGASGLVVVDIDVKAGAPGLESWRDLVAELGASLETTVCAETPSGGLHYYYRANGHELRPSAGQLGDGLDVRAGPSYVLVPPSITPAGAYTWALGCGPHEREVAPLPEALAARLATRRTSGHTAHASTRTIPAGQRNDRLARMAGAMRRHGADEAAILAALREHNHTHCDPPLEEEELQRLAEGMARYAPATGVNCTDLGNARRLVARHGHEIRYCYPWRTWLIWTGKRWEEDQAGAIERRAKNTVGSIYAEASDIGDEKERQAVGKWALASESERRIRSMIALAPSELGIPIAPEELDADPWLLNVANGTLDLRTGQLHPHDPADLCTKLAPVAYDPDATLPLWDRFLQDVSGGDEELIAFLARSAGETLTGDTGEERIRMILGPAATGKSTYIEALKATLGDYALTADFETFLQRSFTGGPRPDIARLKGARLVASIEVDEGKRLAQGLLKTVTGGDTVTARRLYQAEFEFRPMFKLWLVANHAPQVQADDSAMWRRLVRVPFDHVIPEGQRDPDVKRTLTDPAIAGPAILAWAVRGCQDWQHDGLRIPNVVRRATEEYRRDQDTLGQFIAEGCTLDPHEWTTAAALRTAYEGWAEENGLDKRDLARGKPWGEGLRAVGCEPEKRRTPGAGTKSGWRGVSLATANDVTDVTDVTTDSKEFSREADTSLFYRKRGNSGNTVTDSALSPAEQAYLEQADSTPLPW